MQATSQRPGRFLVPERGPRGIPPTHSVHATSRVGSGTCEKQTVDRRARTAESRKRPEEQLLLDLRGTPVHSATDQIGVGGLQVVWSLHRAAEDRFPESRRIRLELCVHTLGELVCRVVVGGSPGRWV